jgi:uncharacterized protein (UPF0335 family)
MPRRKQQQTEDKTGAAGPHFDPQIVGGYVRRIERLVEEIASERGKYMADCKAIRDEIGDVLDEAKERGVPRRELKAAIKARDLARKIDALRDNFEAEQRETYDQIRTALGDLADLPLGRATLDAHDESPPRPRAQTAAEALAAGIKPLDGEHAGAAR